MCELNIKIGIIFIMLFSCSLSFAEMYKWVDENGNTHYSESPPASDAEVQKIPPPPPVNTTGAQKELQKSLEKANSLRERRLSLIEEKEKEKAEKTQLKEECKQLNERLNSLQVRPRANKRGEAGNLIRMTEEERQKEINDTKKEMKEKCS